MRTRINKYTIIGERQIKLETPITIEDVRLIINETKKIVIASSMQKDNITIDGCVITYTDALPISEVGDYFTIEIDKGETIKDILGDANVLLSDVSDGKAKIANAINTKGGSASAESSFSQLADDIKDLPIDGIFMNYGLTFSSDVELENILLMSNAYTNIMNEVIEINDYKGLIKTTKQNFYYDKLKKATFPNLYNIEPTGGFTSPKLEELFVPNMEVLDYYLVRNTNIRNIYIGTLKAMFQSGFSQYVVDKLRCLTVGDNTDVNLLLERWRAKEVILEGQSGIDELNSNLYNNLLTKLYDHSTDGQTRTLRLGWLAHVTQENIDYANSKGWTLTT